MAGTSVLKLVVDDKQYEASLKNAKQGMLSLQQSLQAAGKTFSDVDGKVVEYARAIGQMDTVSKTAKGRIGEMSQAFVELKLQYQKMTDAEKQSPLGQAMSKSLDELKTRTINAKQELAELNKELNEIGDTIKEQSSSLFGENGLTGMLQVFGGNLMTKGFEMIASGLKDTWTQSIELAKAGEGVRLAFERLNQPGLLDKLKEATHGTVSEVELMKQAIKFENFKLPLEDLATYLAFAQQKAKDTGESVDYMVNSITTGLGRQSKQILDNLGISAAELTKRMNEGADMTKAVADIIREEMAKAGDYVETAADRAAQANVSLQNKMEELGRKFAPVEEASSQLWTSMKIGILDIIGGPLATLLNQLTEAGRLKNMLNNLNGEPGSGSTKVDQQIKKLNVIKKAGGSNYIFNSTLNGMMEDYNRQIMALDAQIKNGGKRPGAKSGESQDVRYLQQKMDALKIMRDQLAAGAKELSKPVDVKIETKGAEQNVESLKVKLIELEAQRKKAIAAGDNDLSKNLAKQINQVKSDIKGLNPTALKTGGSGKKNLPEYSDFSKLLFKNGSQDLQAEAPFTSVFSMLKDKSEFDPENILGSKSAWESYKDTITETIGSIGESMNNLTEWSADFNPYQENMDKLNKTAMQSKMAFGLAANAVSTLGAAFASMDDPGAKAAGTVMQAIASLALSFAQAAVMAALLGPIGWIAWMGAGVAALATTISTVHQLTGFAQGGIVEGNSYSGDNIYAGNGMINAGELVLTKAQQGNLASQLQGNGLQNMNIAGRIKGTDIILSIDRSLKLEGKQLLTWGR